MARTSCSPPLHRACRDLAAAPNYKTDKGKFPAWSPFLDGPGIVTIGPSAGKATSDEVRQLADKLGTGLPDASPGVCAYSAKP